MRETYKPVLADWLDILGGIIWLLAEGFIVLVIIGLSVGFGTPHGLNLLRLWVVLIGLAVPGFLSIYGGVCAVRRRGWFIALIGSIKAIPAGFGIAALVLVILSKNEFREKG